MKRSLFALAPVAGALAIAGCGGGSGSSAPAPAQGTNAAATTAAGITIAHGKVGSYLADAKGRALYLFEADKGSSSTCYSACASLWPPITSSTAVTAGSGVQHSLLGSTTRKDGTREITYHGHPLYYYAADTKPGLTTGQGLNQFGAKWYLVAPNGNKIDDDES
jgi:predicted lipoprotein with Yx(FWY)xxD motif